MANRRIKDFFNGRLFEIPKYQRGFAWEKRNIRELFDDINEAIDTNSNHYIGTFVLSKNQVDNDSFYIVDGQQRVTTLILIINTIINYLDKSDHDFYRRFYVKENECYRLKMLGKDNNYLYNLLNDSISEPENKSQRLLKQAYEEIQTIVKNIDDKKDYLNTVERLEIMEFIEQSEGDAIRIFQTVNDRGRPLTNMEKAKSLLIYFSNKYLAKKLDDRINTVFGEIFEIYDDIKYIGETVGITPIKNIDFDEDNIMRYHFITFSDDYYDATATYVLDFLKFNLTAYRKTDKENGYINMESFINDYVNSLHSFFKSFSTILEKTKHEVKYYKIFSILSISATLYPLIVKFESLGILEKRLPYKGHKKYSFFDIIEIIDVRIYKTRGTDPRAEISRFAHSLDDTTSLKEIEEWLLRYNQQWMSKEEFIITTNSNIYGNRALPYILIEYCEKLIGRKYSLSELQYFNDKNPTIEHILAKTPKFTYKSVGFQSGEHYLEYKDTLGNLTILEKGLNSAVQNKIPLDKVLFYDKSKYKMTNELSTSIHTKKKFTRVEIEKRTKHLVGELVDRWWC